MFADRWLALARSGIWLDGLMNYYDSLPAITDDRTS
jgi:hypothetical protein